MSTKITIVAHTLEQGAQEVLTIGHVVSGAGHRLIGLPVPEGLPPEIPGQLAEINRDLQHAGRVLEQQKLWLRERVQLAKKADAPDVGAEVAGAAVALFATDAKAVLPPKSGAAAGTGQVTIEGGRVNTRPKQPSTWRSGGKSSGGTATKLGPDHPSSKKPPRDDDWQGSDKDAEHKLDAIEDDSRGDEHRLDALDQHHHDAPTRHAKKKAPDTPATETPAQQEFPDTETPAQQEFPDTGDDDPGES